MSFVFISDNSVAIVITSSTSVDNINVISRSVSLEAVLAVLPLLVAAEAVVWRTDKWQSSAPQTTEQGRASAEVEALVPFGISGIANIITFVTCR